MRRCIGGANAKSWRWEGRVQGAVRGRQKRYQIKEAVNFAHQTLPSTSARRKTTKAGGANKVSRGECELGRDQSIVRLRVLATPLNMGPWGENARSPHY